MRLEDTPPPSHALRRRRRRLLKHGRAPTPRARYYAIIGPAPRAQDDWTPFVDQLRDPDAPAVPSPAWAYWQRIWYALGLDSGLTDLSHAERTSLQRLEKRWRRRARGLDPRWNAGATTNGGRLPAAIERALPARDEEPDPWP